MPLDFNLLGGGGPRINTPFENLAQVLQLRNQQDAARGIAEQRASLAEERRQKTETARQEAAATAQFKALWSRTDPATGQPVMPTLEEAAPIIGGENAAKVFKGIAEVQKLQWENQQQAANGIAALIDGIEAWPAPDRQTPYATVRQSLIAKQLIKPGDMPETYNASWVAQKKREAMTAAQRIARDTPPAPLHVGNSLVQPNAQGQYAPVYTAPAAPEKLPKPASAQEFEYRNSLTPEQRAAYDQYQTADANRRRPVVNVNAAAGDGLDPDGQELLATQYRILGSSAIPTRISGADRARIINQAAAQIRTLGQNPVMAIQRQAARKADAGSLNKITTMASTAEAFENKAIQQADLVRELSEKVDRTQFPLLNRALLAGKRDLLGDADTQLLFNALTTFTSEYAKIIEGSTGSAAGSSDAARRAAASLAGAALNKATLAKTLDLMQKEMRYTIQGYGATIDHITNRMGGVAPQPTASAPSAAAESIEHRVWRVGGKQGPEPK